MPTTPPRRILIIRPSALGDVCRTVPVLVSLRQAWPNAEIHWLVQDTFLDAVRAHPALDRAIPFARGRLGRCWRSPLIAGELFRWLRDLRTARYDVVIDCQGLWRSGLMTLITRAPRRVGLRTARELGWLGYTIRHRPAPGLHTVDEMLSLLEPLDVEPVRDMSLYPPSEDQAWWQDRCTKDGLKPGAYAVIAPANRWTSKRWPADRWRALIEPLADHGLRDLVTVGSAHEATQTAAIRPEQLPSGVRMIDLAGASTIGQLLAVVERCGFLVSNDSAPLHMAVGFDRRCLGLFGPTDPAFVGPYARPESAIRRFEPREGETVSFRDRRLGDQLMRLISVDDVKEAIDRILTPSPVRSGAGTDGEIVVRPTARIRQSST